MDLSTFLLSSAAILLTPGPTNTILAASGAAMGLRRAAALPLAEALGYAVAIAFFLWLTGTLTHAPLLLPALKGVAAAWLLLSARKLWSLRVTAEAPDRHGAFMRVFVTTLLNPKAMLVGAIVIPGLMPAVPVTGIGAFVALSLAAGLAWTALGASLPALLRRHAYRLASVVVGGFAVAAAISATQ